MKAIPLTLLSLVAFMIPVTAQPASSDGQAENSSGVPRPEVPEFATADAARYGRQVAEFADAYDRGWKDEVSQGTMTLFDAGGDSVRRSFSRMIHERADEGDKLIIKFLSPAEIRGVTALTHENPGSSDDNWLYLPANKRVRRVSGANNTASFQGTEFTYEDLSNIDPSEYEWRFVEMTTIDRDGLPASVYKLDARPTYDDTGYSHIVVYFNAESWRQERIEYFDKAGKHLKTRDGSGWHVIHGRFWRARNIEMVNHQTGKRTLLEQQKEFLNLSLYKSSTTGKARSNLREDLFTTRAIQS